MLGFGTTMMCTWEAVFFSNNAALTNGGNPTLIYGFLFSWIGNFMVAVSLAEMCSMAPTSGGQYHWVAMLAPERAKVFLSWITGWIATIGWNANTAAGIYFSGTMIQGLLVLNYPETYVLHRWQGTLLMYAALLFAVFVNTIAARLLPKIEGLILIVHTLGFFAILIPLIHLSQHNDAHTVFSSFVDSGGWSSNGLAFFVGLISTNLPFIGYDGPCHMAEEVRDAARIVPWSIVCTILINGVLGFSVSIAFAFCTTDPADALTSPTGYDFIYVFFQATQSHAGTSIMTALLIALVTCAAVGFLATASRQTFAFARDQGLPGSGWLSYVSDTKRIPLRAVGFCTLVTAAICLINIGSTAAFNAIVSLTLAGLYISYLIPIALMVMHRVRGTGSVRFGPWTLGRMGLPVNVLAIVFLVISVLFSFFPGAIDPPVTALSMNWSCAVFGGFVIIGLIYYGLVGRKVYNGPIWEI
ncbi:hypothetical protein ANO11243_010470 [Dothideomycetidae sp. 11243]|nr:hypothetical protein ANO11243_010470 [fungal sp. No.11243]